MQELRGFESDHAFHLWLNRNPVLTRLFPRRLTRQKFAERPACAPCLPRCGAGTAHRQTQTGYCAALSRYFHGVREHAIFTPGGHILHLVQVAGNRHDVNGLYALLHDSFAGHLVADNAYWPKKEKREELAQKGVTITALPAPACASHAATVLEIKGKYLRKGYAF